MNGKFLILFFVCCNIVALVFSAACIQDGGTCGGFVNNAVLSLFFEVDETQDLSQSGGYGLSQNFSDATSALTRPVSSGIGSQIVGFILDGLNMIMAMIALLTPFPLLTFLFSLNMPMFITIMIAFPLFILWVLALMELVRGVSL
jgi:hypothetical protein